MVTGRQLEAQARRFDRALRVLEREAVRSLDGALRRAAIRLEDELRRLYTPALRAGTAESLAYREARARMLLAQVQSLLLVTDHVPAEGALTRLLRDSYAAGAADGATLLGMYGQQAVAIHAVVPESVLIAATNASARLAHRGAQFASRAESIIIDGLIRGQGFRRTASELRRETGITRYSAERIIYTESIRASDSGRQATYEASGISKLQLLSTLDSRLCGYCSIRSGNVYEMGDIEVPLHPHCLIGSTHVSAKGVRGHSKRWYEGPVVTITTRSGNRLTCTPNHPVLTDHGWIPAGSLNVGSHVIRSLGGDRVDVGLLDDEHVEASVEEIVDTLVESGEMPTRPVPVAPEHFHGDGGGSQVAVIGADRHLWDGFDAAFQQQVMQLAFVGAVEAAVRLHGLRGLQLGQVAHRRAAHSFVCSAHLPLALFGRHLGPLDVFSFALPAQGNAASLQALRNDVAADAVLLGESIHAHAVDVGSGNLDFGQLDAAVRSGSGRDRGNGHAAGSQGQADGARVAAELVSDLLNGVPFATESDEVINLGFSDFAGHVFNLETKEGYYVAEGILTHNCRCLLVPWKQEWQDAGLTDDDWFSQHRAASLERSHEDPRYGVSPSEKWQGREEAPKPVWTPPKPKKKN